jgi:hypothetical protein
MTAMEIASAPHLRLRVMESISFKPGTAFVITPMGLQSSKQQTRDVLIGRNTGQIDSKPEELGMGAKHAMIKYSPGINISRIQVLYVSGFGRRHRNVRKSSAATAVEGRLHCVVRGIAHGD